MGKRTLFRLGHGFKFANCWHNQRVIEWLVTLTSGSRPDVRSWKTSPTFLCIYIYHISWYIYIYIYKCFTHIYIYVIQVWNHKSYIYIHINGCACMVELISNLNATLSHNLLQTSTKACTRGKTSSPEERLLKAALNAAWWQLDPTCFWWCWSSFFKVR